ncbi:winged helix-turn-helix domain-containing protein [Streptomyces mangrovisoli]|uniref:HTH gntR-type domain-containing protein n=1 Tax=Streptomyces mangrovisoli TaxID=1428628 RepID=A0A1J4NTF4_9ACTN|nr:GntR family transcriptional regulator [Streptomyces mangrovisoli]OIJ64828.1 hypothetical protein WN71_026925 [Streptomyces mangrovisoli]
MNEQQAGDGSGVKEFERVARELLDRIGRGVYPVGTHLPAQRELSDALGVSRVTLQRALKILAAERWIESRRGSGSRVVKSPTTSPSRAEVTGATVGDSIEAVFDWAFEQPEVSLDVYTLTSETLHWQIQAQALRIRRRQINPSSITLRMLLPAEGIPLPYPSVKDSPDDQRLRFRLDDITKQYTSLLDQSLRALRAEKLVPDVDVQIRRVKLTPTFKLYVFNRTVAVMGPYEVVERDIELDDGDVTALDVLGFEATLTQFGEPGNPQVAPSRFGASMRSWYESVWDRLGVPEEGPAVR